MKATQYKKMYPKLWHDIYNGMVESLKITMPQADIDNFINNITGCRIEVIAHNAAFLACSQLHRIIGAKHVCRKETKSCAMIVDGKTK